MIHFHEVPKSSKPQKQRRMEAAGGLEVGEEIRSSQWAQTKMRTF